MTDQYQFDITTMFLALVIKQAGGSISLHKQTFMDMPDNYEIMSNKDSNGDLILSLVEDQDLVAAMRKKRAEEDARQGFIHGIG